MDEKFQLLIEFRLFHFVFCGTLWTSFWTHTFICSDSDDSDDDDDDDEAELLRELERIRKEREEDQRRKEAEREREEQDTINREAMAANPLLGAPTSFNIKKK